MGLLNRRGQSVTEYAVVFSVVAAAVIGMQLFVKRGLQAKTKDVTDFYTNAGGTGIAQTKQYEPYYTADGQYNIKTENQPYEEEMTAGGKIARKDINDKTTRKSDRDAESKVDLSLDDSWQ